MSVETAPSLRAFELSGARGTGDLALAFEEAFTATVRLRTGRQVASDAQSFRTHVKNLLVTADNEARAVGYDPDTIKLAVYAFVAFLDESVLNSGQPMFSEWPRQPLQEEVFGDHTAGETFFQYLRHLLDQRPGEEGADLIEVFHICLILGFRGRFGDPRAPELRALIEETEAYIRSVRGEIALSTSWRPVDESIQRARDPWLRRLGVLAVVGLVTATTLFVVYSVLLRSGLAGV